MLSAYSKNKDAAAKLIKFCFRRNTKEHAIKCHDCRPYPLCIRTRTYWRSAVVCAITARFRECSRASFHSNRRRLQQGVDGFSRRRIRFSTGQCLLRKN
jgi:hypothetical protein